jgi:uncharacterized membrane protein (DUF4010 family)
LDEASSVGLVSLVAVSNEILAMKKTIKTITIDPNFTPITYSLALQSNLLVLKGVSALV